MLDAALARSDRSRGGRPPYDAVLMFRVLVLQALYSLSDEQAEFQLRDRLSFMRFAGLGLHQTVPDAKTIWLYREQLKQAGAMERLFCRFDEVLASKGFLAMGGQIIDATLIAAPRQKLTIEEKATIREGRTPEGWSRHKRAQKDCPLDAQARAQQAQTRGHAAAGHSDRGADFWLQKPHRHRPTARVDPPLDGDRCRPA
jgi:IS5 family transposase